MKLVPTFETNVSLELYMKVIRKRVNNCLQEFMMQVKERKLHQNFCKKDA